MKIVGDANVLLSAVLGGRARVILYHPSIEEVAVAAPTLAEVQEYALLLSRKKRLPLTDVLLAVAALPVSIVEREAYFPKLPRAQTLIGGRDPDDADTIALALHLKWPLWSNDNDCAGIAGLQWYTTAELLRKLGLR